MWRKRENPSLPHNFTMFTNAKAYNNATDLLDLLLLLCNCFSYLRSFVTDKRHLPEMTVYEFLNR